jgi:hypothetical protein
MNRIASNDTIQLGSRIVNIKRNQVQNQEQHMNLPSGDELDHLVSGRLVLNVLPLPIIMIGKY